MKKRNIILGVILVMVVILCGIGMGYFIYYKEAYETYEKISVEIEIKKNNYYEYCSSVVVNGKNISNELEINEFTYCDYDVYNNLAIITVYEPDFSFLYIYNSKGNKLLSNADISEDLFTHFWDFDNENGKIIFYSEITDMQGGVSDRVLEITGKDLYDLTCDELNYYKDKIVASEKSEVKLLENKISDVTVVEKNNLENYIVNGGNFYQKDLLIDCQN